MARRTVDYSIKACERWLAQGRGRGEKETYKPWVRIGDFSSRGVSAAIPGIKTKRVHELLSGIETRAFLVAEFNETNGPFAHSMRKRCGLLSRHRRQTDLGAQKESNTG